MQERKLHRLGLVAQSIAVWTDNLHPCQRTSEKSTAT